MRLTEGMSKELEEHNVKVFAVAPPAILSDMTKFIMDDEGGKQWRPDFKSIFEDGRDHPPEIVADLILELVSGKADRLHGRYFLATKDINDVLAQEDKILAEDLMTLRLKMPQ
jgi:NAD(P)-dependent dehydrogenase (short-subunit alcohol dehydrogenase family)